MHKIVTVILAMVVALAFAGPVLAQGGPSGPANEPVGTRLGPGDVSGSGAERAGEAVGPGGPPDAAPGAPVGQPPAEPSPVRSEAGDTDRVRAQDRDGTGTQGPAEPESASRIRARLQVCDEDCAPREIGLLVRTRALLQQRVPAMALQRMLGFAPLMMLGTASVEDGALIFDLAQGNRAAQDAMTADPAPALITTDAVIMAVYPDTERTAEIIDWDGLAALLTACPDAVVQILGYMDAEGDLVAQRIQVRIPAACSID